jgi:hypothetical protein
VNHIIPEPGNGLWRYLLFDPSDPSDPRWLLLTVSTPGDVRPADTDDAGRRYTDWPAITAWLRATVGRGELRLVPLDEHAVIWRVDERRGEG